MRNERLRVYYGPTSPEPQPAATEKREQVSIPLSDVFPLLADAVVSQRTWLNDFADEEIAIPTDLYELILAYQYYHRPTTA